MTLGSYYVSDRYEFVIFVSGKCANTTIRTWFLKVDHDEVYPTLKIMRRRANKLKKRHLNSAKLEKYTKIIVVRNPYDRVLSLFLDKFVFPKDEIRLKLTAEDVSFERFLRLLKKSKFEKLDGHYLPQSYCRENISFDHIIKIENNGLKKLKQIVDCDFPFSEKAYDFKSNYSKDNDSTSSLPVLTSAKASAYEESSPVHRDQLLTEDMRKEIYDIYKKDFEMFGYEE